METRLKTKTNYILENLSAKKNQSALIGVTLKIILFLNSSRNRIEFSNIYYSNMPTQTQYIMMMVCLLAIKQVDRCIITKGARARRMSPCILFTRGETFL